MPALSTPLAPSFPSQPRDIEHDADSAVVQQLALWYWKDVCGRMTLPTRENVAPLRAALVAAGFKEADTQFAVAKIATKQRRNVRHYMYALALRQAFAAKGQGPA